MALQRNIKHMNIQKLRLASQPALMNCNDAGGVVADKTIKACVCAELQTLASLVQSFLHFYRSEKLVQSVANPNLLIDSSPVTPAQLFG